MDIDVQILNGGNKKFKTTNLLSAVYSQQVSDLSEGYHKAEFNLKTNLPSFNPNQSGVESVICKTEANEDYDINFNWVEGKQTKNNIRRSLEESDKSSKPDISLINNDIKLLCANCFTKGEATLALRIRGKIFPPKLKEASITLSGNFLMNLDFALEASKEISPGRRKKASNNSPIANIKTGDFEIPDLLEIGPEIDLVAAADAFAGAKATLGFGGNFSLPNFSVKASFEGLPNFEQSGFNPIVNAQIPSASAKAFAIITATLKSQLAFGINILKGRILNKKVGFELAGLLKILFRLGSCKRKVHPHVKSSLGDKCL
ncbi:hypothetical protein C1646_763509 [Rhizophagus diaphanus]|nr:hypothetical protein C1646_763509 [Rhizophagus diaphanus] [Rhizophagus sp. MUCL 43196]